MESILSTNHDSELTYADRSFCQRARVCVCMRVYVCMCACVRVRVYTMLFSARQASWYLRHLARTGNALINPAAVGHKRKPRTERTAEREERSKSEVWPLWRFRTV